eukprot:5462134-Prymnesium_polylepis.2
MAPPTVERNTPRQGLRTIRPMESPQCNASRRRISSGPVRAADRSHVLSVTTRIVKVLTFDFLLADPLGLRFSGSNLNPLLAWLGGTQYVAYAIRDRTQDRTVAPGAAFRPLSCRFDPQCQAQHVERGYANAALSRAVQQHWRICPEAQGDAWWTDRHRQPSQATLGCGSRCNDVEAVAAAMAISARAPAPHKLEILYLHWRSGGCAGATGSFECAALWARELSCESPLNAVLAP